MRTLHSPVPYPCSRHRHQSTLNIAQNLLRLLFITAGLILLVTKAYGQSNVWVLQEIERELVGTVARDICATHNVPTVRTSGTVLTVGNGSSATEIDPIRFQQVTGQVARTEALTAPGTFTSSLAGISGTVFIYAYRNASGALTIAALTVPGMSTLTGSSGTFVQVTYPSALASQILRTGIYLQSWTMTAGTPATFDVGGGVQQGGGVDCRLLKMLMNNTTSGTIAMPLIRSGDTIATFFSSNASLVTGQTLLYMDNLRPTSTSGVIEPGLASRGGMQVSGPSNSVYMSNTVVLRPNPIPLYSPAPPQP